MIEIGLWVLVPGSKFDRQAGMGTYHDDVIPGGLRSANVSSVKRGCDVLLLISFLGVGSILGGKSSHLS